MFQNYPNRVIVDQFENMLKGKRPSFTEKQLYKKLKTIFNLKSGQITMAASSKQDLLLDLDLDIPQLMSIREDILPCLNNSTCDKVDTMLTEIGNTKVKFPNYINQSLDSPEILDISNHPPHIIIEEGKMMPSSFIPFCALGNNVSVVDQFSLPMCDVFQPKLLDGELCYQLNMRDIKADINQGPLGGLKLVLDYNEERNINVDNLETGY